MPVWEKIATFAFGVVFVIALLGLAIFFPKPTPFQYEVFRIVLALACAGVAAIIPGFLAVRTDIAGMLIRASGALAVFVLVYLQSPAQLVAPSVVSQTPGGAVRDETNELAQPTPTVKANGGVAAGGNIEGSQITITGSGEKTAPSTPAAED